MKKTLIVLCAAVALVGCDRNRGGAGDDMDSTTGSGSGRDTTYRNTTDQQGGVGTGSRLTNSQTSPSTLPGGAGTGTQQ